MQVVVRAGSRIRMGWVAGEGDEEGGPAMAIGRW